MMSDVMLYSPPRLTDHQPVPVQLALCVRLPVPVLSMSMMPSTPAATDAPAYCADAVAVFFSATLVHVGSNSMISLKWRHVPGADVMLTYCTHVCWKTGFDCAGSNSDGLMGARDAE